MAYCTGCWFWLQYGGVIHEPSAKTLSAKRTQRRPIGLGLIGLVKDLPIRVAHIRIVVRITWFLFRVGNPALTVRVLGLSGGFNVLSEPVLHRGSTLGQTRGRSRVEAG